MSQPARPGIPLETAVAAAVLVVLGAACTGSSAPGKGLSPLSASGPGLSASAPFNQRGLHKIKHVIILMQENRSFDSYFGTFPDADGIPMKNGVPTVCVPDPKAHDCVRPFHDTSLVGPGGPHAAADAIRDIHGGRMNGFIRSAERAGKGCLQIPNPGCGRGLDPTNVMGYHTAHEIPNYWAWAHDYVLQDHMFSSTIGSSEPAHLYLVSGWSARCRMPTDRMTCETTEGSAGRVPGLRHKRVYPWTDLTYLLQAHHVSWTYFVAQGTQPDCMNGQRSCREGTQLATTPSIWNPLPFFTDVHKDRQIQDVKRMDAFYAEAAAGRLPSVSWLVPNGRQSEHPPASIAAGQAFVTGVVDAVMRSPNWSSSAIFVTWDEWGGYYDHVPPPAVDSAGYGIRVPGLLISPYARRGYIDHQVLSFDAYLKFIEDAFLGGARIDPRTDGRPDSRPAVREKAAVLGNLASEFNFDQAPAPPFILPTHPSPGAG